MTTVTVDLPPIFWDDHVARDCLSGHEVKRTKTYVRVELDREALIDLWSDADYYASFEAHDVEEDYIRRICRSAKSTLRKLEKATLAHYGGRMPNGSNDL